MTHLLAQQIQIAPSGGYTGIGPLGKPIAAGVNTFSNFLTTAIGVMTVIAIIWFIFTFFIGAIGIISSGGDKQALETAKKKITTALIGLVVVIAAVFITNLVGTILGIPDILSFSKMFTQITGGTYP